MLLWMFIIVFALMCISAIVGMITDEGNWFLVTLIMCILLVVVVILIWIFKPPMSKRELVEKKIMVSVIMENANFDTMSDEEIEVIANDAADVNEAIEWYKANQDNFLLVGWIDFPDDYDLIEVNNEKLLQIMNDTD